MTIEEKDFRIVFKSECFNLYLLKSKKELKEDSKDNFKIGGHFIQLKYAIKAIFRFRKSKNYPGKESAEDAWKIFEEYSMIENSLYKSSQSMYTSIIKLKETVLNNEKS